MHQFGKVARAIFIAFVASLIIGATCQSSVAGNTDFLITNNFNSIANNVYLGMAISLTASDTTNNTVQSYQ